MIAEHREAFRVQFIDAPRTHAPVAHEVSLFQHAQVLGNRRPRHRKPGRQLVDRAGVRTDHFEDSPAGGIAQGGESVLYVSIHLP